jgi:hypothetical protein
VATFVGEDPHICIATALQSHGFGPPLFGGAGFPPLFVGAGFALGGAGFPPLFVGAGFALGAGFPPLFVVAGLADLATRIIIEINKNIAMYLFILSLF